MIQCDFPGRKFPEIIFWITGTIVSISKFGNTGTTGIMHNLSCLATGTVRLDFVPGIFKFTCFFDQIEVPPVTFHVNFIIPVLDITFCISSTAGLVISDRIRADLLGTTGYLHITFQDRYALLLNIGLVCR